MIPFNAAEWLLEDREGVALRVRGESFTYAAVRDLVAHTAGGLRELGVGPEHRVLLVLLDGIEFVSAFLGAIRMGAIPVPVNPLLPGRDVAEIASYARAQLALVSAERAAVADDLSGEVLVGELPSGEPAEAYDTWDESPGFWLCTSGTTGAPKLAMHRHIDLRTSAEGYAREVLGISSRDVCYSVGPMFHAYGLGNSLSFPFAAGATAVLERTRPPTPALVADIVRAERPTLFFAVPTFFAALLAADLAADTFASVRHAVSAAEPLPADLFVRFRDRFGVEILDGLGSTEMTHIFVSNRAGRAKPGTSGTPVGGYRVRIADEDGNDANPGHLWVSGDSMATGYWCRSDATRRTFVGEWMRTGDVYERDADGCYTYLGRADDMFKVGGEWVSPAEVEAALIEHPGVLEAAVVGRADDHGLLKAVAFVVASSNPAPTADDLDAHCRARLAGFKRPRGIEIVEALPKTVTGKIQRYKLRDG